MNAVRKYLNYLVFASIVLVVVSLAVSHSHYVRTMVDDMGSADSGARSHAAMELIKSEQFSDSITGESVETRMHAVDALVSLAHDTSVVLGTGKDDPDYRAQAVKQCIALLKDIDKNVRAHAGEALEQIGDSTPGCLTELVNGIGDGDQYVRKGVNQAFTDTAGIGPKKDVIDAIIAKMNADAGTRSPGGDILGSTRFVKEGGATIAVPELLAVLTEKDPKDATKFKNDEGARSGAAEALGTIGDPAAVPQLIESMQHDSPTVRRVSIGAIAVIADRSGQEALVAAVKDPTVDPEARLQAASGLGRISSPEAITTLVDALSDMDQKMRTAAVGALARAGRPNPNGPANEKVLAALIGALGSEDDNTRLGAAQTLATVAAPEANTALVRDLRDSNADADVRAACAAALGFRANGAAVAPLIAALSDPNGDVRDAVRDALAAIGPDATQALIGVLKAGRTDALYAEQALAHQGESALPALVKAAQNDANPLEQRWAAVALGDLGGAGAGKPLQALSHSPDPDVAFVAKAQLDKLGIAE